MQFETQSTIAQEYSVERRYPRFFLSAPITAIYHVNGWSESTRGITLEISLGGLSAVLCGPPPVGERVSVRLKLMNTAFETSAIVRHSTSGRTGFEFVELTPAHRSQIDTCIQRSVLCPWPKAAGTQAGLEQGLEQGPSAFINTLLLLAGHVS